MAKKMRAGVWAGIVILLFSIVLLVQSLQFPYSGSLGLGPGFFPTWLSGFLLILSLFYIYESMKGDRAEGESMPRGKALKNILFILLCTTIFLLLVTFLGFMLSSTIFLFLLLYREYKWYANAGISLGVSLFLFWLFGAVLHVPLPVNGLGW